MSSSEKFCLKWNDFEANVSCAFRELREDKDFFDVTLACDDEQIQAHKVIVSACSPFFRNVLRRNPHQHPLLYLKGVKYRELLAVLNFMYQGEVNVAQDDLNSFLAVAEELKVKGLTQGNSDDQKSQQSHYRPPAEAKQPERKSRPIAAPVAAQEDDDIEDVTPVKSEPGGLVENQYEPQAGAGAVALEDTYQDQEESYDYEAYDDGSGTIDPSTGMPYADGNKVLMDSMMTSLGGGKWQCLQCGYQSKSTNVRYHIESKHVNNSMGYSCAHCSEVLKTRNALNTHLSVKHRQHLQSLN